MPNDEDVFPVRTGNAIVCEDVRPELGGKRTILGIYSGDIVVPAFEDFLKISLFIELFANKVGMVILDAAVSYAGNDIVKMKAEFDYKDIGSPALIVSP